MEIMAQQSSLRAFRKAHPLWFLGSLVLGWIFFISTARWYEGMFGGGERSKLKGRIDGLKYGDVWLLAASGERDANNRQKNSPFKSIEDFETSASSPIVPSILGHEARSGISPRVRVRTEPLP